MQHYHSEMSQRVARSSARYPQGKATQLQCFRCECAEGLCFVVMKKKSVQKMYKAGRCITCPVHQNTRHTSTYALKFYAIIQGLHSRTHKVHGVVWDWFDVPANQNSNHKMHIDATVFYNDTCMRFEIDGETHFPINGTSRLHTDEEKDDVLRECGVGMLRLHYWDVEVWSRYVQAALRTPHRRVRYTAGYKHCLHPADEQYILEL